LLDKGRAAVIQDIDATPQLCLEKILDFINYPKYVSFLKKLDIYHQEVDSEVRSLPPFFSLPPLRAIKSPLHCLMQDCSLFMLDIIFVLWFVLTSTP
jgi:hypothetical protein